MRTKQDDIIKSGILKNVVRMTNSVYGNPRYKAMVGSVTFRTSPDNVYATDVANLAGKNVVVRLRYRYGYLTLVTIHEQGVKR